MLQGSLANERNCKTKAGQRSEGDAGAKEIKIMKKRP
jgi:hypothetical protein